MLNCRAFLYKEVRKMHDSEEKKIDNKLHVLDSFQHVDSPCCVPSIKLLQMVLFNKVIKENCFEHRNGSLFVKDFGIIDGITYQISGGNFVITIGDNNRVTSASINNNNELELII